MARRRETIFEHLYPHPPGTTELAKLWNERRTVQLLNLVWSAYDDLYTRLLSRINWTLSYEDLERSITMELERSLQRVTDSFAPYLVQHGPFEHESRSSAPAQPPAYDIAFVWNENPRVMWPLEAKVLKSDVDSHLRDYIATVQARYLTCKYAPFSNGGAMLAYLGKGNAATVLNNIGSNLHCALMQHPSFPHRDHQVSNHVRFVPKGKDYPPRFRCHHLVMRL